MSAGQRTPQWSEWQQRLQQLFASHRSLLMPIGMGFGVVVASSALLFFWRRKAIKAGSVPASLTLEAAPAAAERQPNPVVSVADLLGGSEEAGRDFCANLRQKGPPLPHALASLPR